MKLLLLVAIALAAGCGDSISPRVPQTLAPGTEQALRVRVDGVRNRLWVLSEDRVDVYDAGTKRYEAGERVPQKLFSKQELEFLASIGCSAQELFDFIDDLARNSSSCLLKSF